LLVWEKIPLFLLAFASSVVTFVVQKKGGAVGSVEIYPLTIRVANALVSYVKYIEKTIWPANLAVFYPYSDRLPAWQVIGAGVLLGFITFAAMRSLRQHPWFVVGWLWFVGTLVPVIGLVQVGLQALADRYTYVPMIGLFIIVAWGVPQLMGRWRHKEKLLATTTTVLLTVFIVTSWLQTRYWQNSNDLFERALDVTENNYLAHNALGNALKGQGKTDEALGHYLKALEIRPEYAAPHYNIGHTLAGRGNNHEAIDHFQKAIQIKPDYAAAHDNLGYVFMIQGKFVEAIFHYSEALRIKPDDAEVHNRLGLAMVSQGQFDNSITHFFKAVKINPLFAAAHNNLGATMIRQGMIRKAVVHFKAALRIKPDHEEARKNLKSTLAALANGDAGARK
jgi:tetratricopeptide (TPR) repeat protein